MAQFFILHTVKKSGDIADFYVEFSESELNAGDEFVTYDTHHRVDWKVIGTKAMEDIIILECTTPHGIGFDDQFAGAVVNTEGTDRLELFRYDHTRDKDLFDPKGFLYNKLRKIIDQHSDEN